MPKRKKVARPTSDEESDTANKRAVLLGKKFSQMEFNEEDPYPFLRALISTF